MAFVTFTEEIFIGKFHFLCSDLDYLAPFILDTYALSKALGFTLSQKVFREPILMGGGCLSNAENRNYVTGEKFLGISYAVEKCEYYLIIAYTDHKSLLYLSSFKAIINRRFRWIE